MCAWARETLQEAEGHTTPQGSSRESKIPNIFLSYLSALIHTIDYEPSFHGEVIGE
jgi:hypothetical protein